MRKDNRVIFWCPECSEKIEVKNLSLNHNEFKYHQDSVPANIASSLKNSFIICPVCIKTYKIFADIPRVSLTLIDKKDVKGYD